MAENNAPPRIEFDVRKVYLKDVSFESPQAPAVFSGNPPTPSVDVQLRVNSQTLDTTTGFHECVLTATVTASAGEKTLFLIEVQQAGVFHITGIEGAELARALQVACPNVLLPFAREEISTLTLKGGFPQLLLAPVNFDVLYEQNRSQQAAGASGDGVAGAEPARVGGTD